MRFETARTASGRTAQWPWWVDARCHATPPSTSESTTRSLTESKNAPRTDAVPVALATAPSSRAGTAARIRTNNPISRWPRAMTTAQAAASTRPSAVKWSAFTRREPSEVPTGATPSSTALRKRPSNTLNASLGPVSPYQGPSVGWRDTGPGGPGQRSRNEARMASVPSARIRNVALVGHGGSGKTTLAEALLFSAGAIPRMGRVEDGTAATDTEPEELKRQLSASLG